MQFLTTLMGDGKPLLQIVLGVAAALLVLLIAVALYRAILGRRIRGAGGGRGRQPRLGVVDSYDLDRQRQLVLVRRDNIEHLIMIGGPNDLLIEAAISRVPADPRQPKEFAAADAAVEPPAPAMMPPTIAVTSAAAAPVAPAPIAPAPVAPAPIATSPAPAIPQSMPQSVPPASAAPAAPPRVAAAAPVSAAPAVAPPPVRPPPFVPAAPPQPRPLTPPPQPRPLTPPPAGTSRPGPSLQPRSEPGKTEPAKPAPMPGASKPADAKPADVKPADVKPAPGLRPEPKMFEAKPAETKPNDKPAISPAAKEADPLDALEEEMAKLLGRSNDKS